MEKDVPMATSLGSGVGGGLPLSVDDNIGKSQTEKNENSSGKMIVFIPHKKNKITVAKVG